MSITPEQFEEGISNTRVNTAVINAARAVVYGQVSCEDAADQYGVNSKSVANAISRAEEEYAKQPEYQKYTVHVPSEQMSSISAMLKSLGCKIVKKY